MIIFQKITFEQKFQEQCVWLQKEEMVVGFWAHKILHIETEFLVWFVVIAESKYAHGLFMVFTHDRQLEE